MMIADKALVVFSGGQDSTTCLFWAKQHFAEVQTLTFAYGQKHQQETSVARRIAELAGVSFTLLDAPLIGGLNTFVPGRNLFFLSIAAVIARERGIRHIITGVSHTDYSGYPDCRDTFIRSLNATLNLAMDEQFVIHTPLMELDKAQTWALADSLGVFDLVRTQTLTCYNGIVGDGCGHCPACKLRQHGLQQYLAQKQQTANAQ